ncbi:Ca-activated chloride channel family protein [Gracilibacillus ureilyticus]|uniref:Ca-activated chloride channel family protein n=2 Tax=Gracilibacillus ureilyticus TaxID=531814 RepID=A0A1H9U6X0_9BACI|nr:Ca-activated chloride channel family protein [Gracilibacillus ureilyticus]
MKRQIIFFLTILLLAAAVIGCSNDDSAKGNENEDQESNPEEEVNSEAEDEEAVEVMTAPEAATEPEDMINEGPGELVAIEDMDSEEWKQAIENLPEDLTANETYNHLVQWLAADYSEALKKYEEFNPSFIASDAPVGEGDDSDEEEVKEKQIALLLDASGSMGAAVGGEVKMKAAKEALQQFVADQPEETKVLLRVYGHVGDGSEEKRKISCESTDVVYPLSTYDEQTFKDALSQFEPAGWTPLASSILAAKNDLQSDSGENVENIVYIISDGEETCGGDPVAAAKELHDSGIATAVNIIGFNVGNEAQVQLKKVAEAGGGTFTNVNSGKEIFEIANENITNARESVDRSMWRATEGVDLTWDAIHKNKEVDSIASFFGDVVGDENKLLRDGLNSLKREEVITEETAEEVMNLLEERLEKIDQLNDEKKQSLKDKVAEEKEKTKELLDEMREQAANN